MNWKKIKETVAFKGWRSMLQRTYELPNGKEAIFDIVTTSDFVTIVAFTKNKEAILVKQYRPGPEMQIVSFPEGGVEGNEAPEKTAARELLEETGYIAKKFIPLKIFRDAYRTEKQICLLALDCEKVGTQKLDATEFIDVFLLPIEKLRSLLTNPTDESFTNVGAGYLALDYMKWL